jgi:hypothetical protein
MATFIIKQEIPITRQEGDHSDIVIHVPAILPIDGATVEFAVFKAGAKIIKKVNADMTITDQVITIPFLPADTKGKPGTHKWELQIIRESVITTIGRGPFIIVQELIK